MRWFGQSVGAGAGGTSYPISPGMTSRAGVTLKVIHALACCSAAIRFSRVDQTDGLPGGSIHCLFALPDDTQVLLDTSGNDDRPRPPVQPVRVGGGEADRCSQVLEPGMPRYPGLPQSHFETTGTVLTGLARSLSASRNQ